MLRHLKLLTTTIVIIIIIIIISARQHICYSALYAIARPSVRHTGGSVKDV